MNKQWFSCRDKVNGRIALRQYIFGQFPRLFVRIICLPHSRAPAITIFPVFTGRRENPQNIAGNAQKAENAREIWERKSANYLSEERRRVAMMDRSKSDGFYTNYFSLGRAFMCRKVEDEFWRIFRKGWKYSVRKFSQENCKKCMYNQNYIKCILSYIS